MKKGEKMVEIVLYKPAYKNDFIRLNREWIETYFKYLHRRRHDPTDDL